MSHSIQFITNNVPGHGSADGRSFPCSGLSGKAISLSSQCSRSYCKTISYSMFVPLKCSLRGKILVCKASSGGYRRNSEFSRQNRFSRNKNRQNEERDGSDNFEEPDVFPKNGPLLSMSGAPRFQATATPGPREKEIVELFRKVQAQLRERASVKEEKKKVELPGQGKESETVDSLLKLLRKHTTQQGKKDSDNNASTKDYVLDHSKQNGALSGNKGSFSLDLGNIGKAEAHEDEPSSFTRPVSNFQRRSPVPRVKFQTFSNESITETYIRPKRQVNEDDDEVELEPKLEMEPVLAFADDGDEFDEISEDDEPSDDEDDYIDNDEEEEEEEEEEEAIAVVDYNSMKLTELRALAKSRGMKGFSKLKKADLVELLSGVSM